MKNLAFLIAVVLGFTACGGEEGKPRVDLDTDSDRNGVVDATGEEDALEEVFPGAIVPVNVDDDDGDKQVDCEAPGGRGADEDDLIEVLLQPGGGEAVLSLSGDTAKFRVFHENMPVLGLVGSDTVTEYQLGDPGDSAITFLVEGIDFNSRATLKVEQRDAGGQLIDSDQVVFSSAPFMMYNHLDPAEVLYVGITDDNQEMREGIKAAIGAENVREYDVDLYDGEIWFQDEFEFAYQQTPRGPMDLVLDAVTDWGLDIFPEEELLGPGFGWLERGERPATIHTDSTGNLECTPPLSVAGVEYPFGRIYYGGKPGGKQMVEGLRTFLDAQQIQAPVELNVTWLIVGHVDEFITFVPDSSSAKGFKVLMADHQATMDILQGLDPRMAIPRYAEWGYSTVQELLDDPIMEMNAQIDQLHMQPLQSKIREVFGLGDDDIIPVPVLWTIGVDSAMAMMPNMINLAVYNQHLLIADPVFRTLEEHGGEEEDLNANWQLDPGEDLNGDGLLTTFRDPMISHVTDRLPAELDPHFFDIWSSYHMKGGEVHCATNILRTPRSDLFWWQVE